MYIPHIKRVKDIYTWGELFGSVFFNILWDFIKQIFFLNLGFKSHLINFNCFAYFHKIALGFTWKTQKNNSVRC